MRDTGRSILWLGLGAVAVAAFVWAVPRAFPLQPFDWSLDHRAARTIALERLRDLGEPIEDAYVVVRFRVDGQLERRLQMAAADLELARLRDSALADSLVLWDVLVYPPGARPGFYEYRALIDRDGQVLSLRKQMPEGEGEDLPPLAEDDARRRAWDYLATLGVDRDRLEPEATVRRTEVGERVDLTLQYRLREQALGADHPYGIEVRFAGDRLVGFARWYDDPDLTPVQAALRQVQLVFFSQAVAVFLITLLVAIPFLKRYHDGQLGVRRGVQLFALTVALALVFMALGGRSFSEGTNFGFITRHQTTWLAGAFGMVFQFGSLGVLGLMAWSVGESICRQRWAYKLASIDALFRGKWGNATVARSALYGLVGGVAVAALSVLLLPSLRAAGVWPSLAFLYGGGIATQLPGLALFAVNVAVLVPLSLFAFLLVPSWAFQRLPAAAAWPLSLAVALLSSSPALILVPLEGSLPLWLLGAAVPLLLFRYADLLAAVLAALTNGVLVSVIPLLFADTPWLQVNGLLPLVALAAPLAVSWRHLGRDDAFVYHYDDIPPHVRRIADRERQRVELETARGIQSSILPDLPPQLNGIEIAHTYRPATEVGGDFYDVLALDDGRLAVAVGDVAGHGVSSGLVMSMAKSALAVQVSFDPEVAAVVTTLNRMVYQSARQRLLTTLCYALIDPRRRELYYASAGHLFPYRVSARGEVVALEAGSYPLGVRGAIDPQVRTARLDAGDLVFMYSDGLVEATPEDSDEPYGFDRLEATLGRLADQHPEQMRDAVLADVEAYTGLRPREDDLTILVLKIPA